MVMSFSDYSDFIDEKMKIPVSPYKDRDKVFLYSVEEFKNHKGSIDFEYNRKFTHFGRPSKYPCVIASKFKDGKSGPAYYHKFFYNVEETKCKKCGKIMYTWEGMDSKYNHDCNKNIILPTPVIEEKEEDGKYYDMGQNKRDIII